MGVLFDAFSYRVNKTPDKIDVIPKEEKTFGFNT